MNCGILEKSILMTLPINFPAFGSLFASILDQNGTNIVSNIGLFFLSFFWNLDHLGYKKGAEMDPTAPQKRAPKHTRKRAPKRETFATMFGPFFGRENAVTSRTTNGIGSKDRIWRP